MSAMRACPGGAVAGDTLAPVSCRPSGFANDQIVTLNFTEEMCVKPPAPASTVPALSAKERWALQSSPTCGYAVSARPLREKPRFMDYTTSSGMRERVYVKF